MKSAAAAVEATREPIMAKKAIQELNIFSFYVLEIK